MSSTTLQTFDREAPNSRSSIEYQSTPCSGLKKCLNLPYYCIHRIASDGYYGFHFVTLLPPCVERFHLYRSIEKNIIVSLLKFAGYIHNHKILPGNIFGLILKNTMAARDFYSTLSKDFCLPSRAKGIIGRDLKFAGYAPHYKILTGNIFGLILKNKMPTTGVSLSVIKSAYISLIIGPRGLDW